VRARSKGIETCSCRLCWTIEASTARVRELVLMDRLDQEILDFGAKTFNIQILIHASRRDFAKREEKRQEKKERQRQALLCISTT